MEGCWTDTISLDRSSLFPMLRSSPLRVRASGALSQGLAQRLLTAKTAVDPSLWQWLDRAGGCLRVPSGLGDNVAARTPASWGWGCPEPQGSCGARSIASWGGWGRIHGRFPWQWVSLCGLALRGKGTCIPEAEVAYSYRGALKKLLEMSIHDNETFTL